MSFSRLSITSLVNDDNHHPPHPNQIQLSGLRSPSPPLSSHRTSSSPTPTITTTNNNICSSSSPSPQSLTLKRSQSNQQSSLHQPSLPPTSQSFHSNTNNYYFPTNYNQQQHQQSYQCVPKQEPQFYAHRHPQPPPLYSSPPSHHVYNTHSRVVNTSTTSSTLKAPSAPQTVIVKTPRGKRHRCTFAGCGRDFSRLSNLKAHWRRHSGEEPYACMHCTRKFKWRSSLKSHELGCMYEFTKSIHQHEQQQQQQQHSTNNYLDNNISPNPQQQYHHNLDGSPSLLSSRLLPSPTSVTSRISNSNYYNGREPCNNLTPLQFPHGISSSSL